MNNYIKISDAARIKCCTVQALYQAMQRGVLKRKKINGKLYTTKEWLQEYEEALNSRQEHAVFNGKPVFNPEKGEYSIEQFAKLIGQEPHNVYWHMTLGKIKAIRRGYYWVIRKDQLQAAQEYFQERTA